MPAHTSLQHDLRQVAIVAVLELASLVIVYADDLAEEVKKRVATLTRQARRM